MSQFYHKINKISPLKKHSKAPTPLYCAEEFLFNKNAG